MYSALFVGWNHRRTVFSIYQGAKAAEVSLSTPAGDGMILWPNMGLEVYSGWISLGGIVSSRPALQVSPKRPIQVFNEKGIAVLRWAENGLPLTTEDPMPKTPDPQLQVRKPNYKATPK